MLKTIKETISDYAIIGGVMVIFTALIRPFISVKDTIRDSIITFLVSMLSGLLMEYWDIPVAVKYGFAGIGGLFGIRLYGIGEKLLKKVEDDPDKILEKLK